MTDHSITAPAGKTPVVSVKDGAVYTNSRDVAAFFGKRHDNVLADIRSIINGLTPEISGVWFRNVLVEQKSGFGVRQNPAFDMTRDGFTLLVMGYTGQKAMAFKVAYIQRFNEMEAVMKIYIPMEPLRRVYNSITHQDKPDITVSTRKDGSLQIYGSGGGKLTITGHCEDWEPRVLPHVMPLHILKPIMEEQGAFLLIKAEKQERGGCLFSHSVVGYAA